MDQCKKVLQLKMRTWIGFATMLTCPIAILLGFVFGNRWQNEYGTWCVTISALYWGAGRNAFVIGFGFSALLSFLYKGYDWRDRVIETLTGICLLGLLVFPSYGKSLIYEGIITGNYEIIQNPDYVMVNFIHIFFGLSSFILPVINLIFIFTRSNNTKTNKKIIRNRIYIASGLLILFNLILNTYIVTTYMMGKKMILPIELGLPLETLNLAIYGFAWLIKGQFIRFLND